MHKILRFRVATVLEHFNNKTFLVEFQKLLLLYLWVLICVKAGNSDAYAVAGKV